MISNILTSGVASVSNVLLLLLLVLAGRLLGAEEFGKLTFVMALSTTFALIADFGLSEISKRAVARDFSLAESYLGNLLVWKFALSIVAFIGVYFAVHLLKSDPIVWVASYLLLIASVSKTYKSLIIAFFQAAEKYKYYAITQVIHNVVIVSCCSAVLFLGGGLVEFAATFLAVKLIDLFFNYLYCHRNLIRITYQFDWDFVKKIQIQALPLGMFVVIVEVYCYADTIMLAAMSSDIEVGYYNAAYKIFEALMIIPFIISQAVSPQLYRLFVIEKESHLILVNKIVKYLISLALLTGFIGCYLSDDLILLLFGSEYERSSLTLNVLMISALFLIPKSFMYVVFISINQQAILLKLGVIGMLINILGNIILIPKYGALGAGVSMLVSEFIIFASSYYFMSKHLYDIKLLRMVVKPLLSLVVLQAVIAMFSLDIGWWLASLIVIIYLISLIGLRFFQQDDIDRVKRKFIDAASKLKVS